VPAQGSREKRQSALPDITVDASRAQSSMYIEQRSFLSTDCAVNEGCAAAGSRTLLRFDTGSCPFIVLGVKPSIWRNQTCPNV
jgi:hypothetical protein